jgi:hypothetical protein
MLSEIGINLLSDAIFVLLGLFIFWLYYVLSKRSQLLKFFGIEKSKRITLYLSNLNVHSGGSTGIDNIRYSFEGSSIAYEESKAASLLQGLFNYFLPSQVDKPEILNKLLISDIGVKSYASPANENSIEQSATIVSVGSPVYNVVSRKIQDDSRILAKFKQVRASDNFVGEDYPSVSSSTILGTAVPVHDSHPMPSGSFQLPPDFVTPSGNMVDSHQPSQTWVQQITIPNVVPYRDAVFGFVQRIYDSENQRCLFYVAGISDFATAGCVYYLVSNWRKLYKKYGKQTPFLVLLKVDGTNNKLWEIVLEKTIT